ncbi:MAG TPA: YCF48-related protein [Bacteroidia bacterium]|nr:YCF48-related protein [Bacteroidia bacterium]
MKKHILLLISASAVIIPVHAQWTVLNPNTTGTFSHLSFPSNDTGYITSSRIYRTFDGGASFDSVHVPQMGQYNSIYFMNNMEGFFSGYDSLGPVVKRTVNAGLNWVDITPANFVGSPGEVKFANTFNGVFLSSSPEFYVTTDGGLTWDTVMFGYDYFNTLDFPDGQTGYIGGFDGTFAYRGVIAKSTDAGATWNVITNLNEWNSWITQVQFVSADTGFAAYNPWSLPAKIIRTNDGGVSWDTVLFTPGNIVRFSFYNADIGFVVSDSGSIYRTADGGMTWQLDRPATAYLNDIGITNNYVYAAGTGGLVLKRNLVTGLAENVFANDFSVFPNPAIDFVKIELPADFTAKSVRVFDISGRKILFLPWEIMNNEVILTTSGLPAGIYFLEISGGEKILNMRFVKAPE